MYLIKKVDSFEKHIDEIKSYASDNDMDMGASFPSYYISRINTVFKIINGRDTYEHRFWLRDYYRNFCDFRVTVSIDDNHVSKCLCDCEAFKKKKKCWHIAAVFKNYADDMFQDEYDSDVLYKDFINRHSSLNLNKNKIKKEVNLIVDIKVNGYIEDYRNYIDIEVKPMIGESKMYSLFNHKDFFTCYNDEYGNCKFGKDFTYDYDSNFFSKKNEVLIKELEDYFVNYKYDKYKSLGKLLDFLNFNNYVFKVNGHVIDNIIEGSPLESEIKKKNDNFILSFNREGIIPLTRNFSYVYCSGELYYLNINERRVLEDIFDNNLKDVIIDKDSFKAFNDGLLKVIKNNAIVDKSAAEDIKINSLSNTELYFDLSNNGIKCKVVFDYKGDKIDYFDSKSNIARDYDKEVEVTNDLVSYGFDIGNKKIEINDIYNEVEFIENGLEELSNRYSIFTTENFKKVKINKKTGVRSTFSIGKDNIFSYDFNLDNINSDELVNIFKDMRAKKKYYRLKNGDILNLDDENLKELEDLTSELNFSDEDIINGRGSIQKYRAIYLDSLKNSRFKNVETNNLFDDFIKNFYEFKGSSLDISKKEMNVLRDYQVTGVKWLYNIHKTGFGGILADEMGLGKTIQTIYYIKQLLIDNKDNKVLIVVPTSLVYNWKHEFELFGNEIKVNIVSGNKEIRKKLILDDANVYITSYGQLREDEELYKDRKFNSMFIDEAQSIKNYVAGITRVVKGIKADTRFALTGTPIENSPLELWSIFDYIMPGYLGNIDKFRSKYKINDFNESTNKLLDGLNKQIRPFILRRKKSDVTKELPDKIENNIYVELTDEQKKIYVAELEKTQRKIEELVNNGEGSKLSFLIFPLLTKLRQICIDPKIVYENYDGGSNKIDSLIYVLNEKLENGEKVLMFTSFKDAMNIVANRLEREDIPYYTISGDVNSKDRMKRVDEFNDRKDPAVFLIMLKAGGTGLNLATASTVIHLDLWWNPQAENQATDRAHRIGQTKNVDVIHIITKGTIEEKILDLQRKKLKLSEKLIDGEIRDKDIVSSLTEKDIRELFANENKD